ncbi:hypothetical protein [Ruminococcus albus]|uniref:Lipoprotein n=1 Tax=Ruminococcus albus TaxID=1264 RepID=A0A1H7JCN8_RUMAL|nr:hypothetical protein [Ruminococcus albus]SEK72411.1 hypothetical protein SAMN05216469_1056 [Ruminococcus albus]
MKRYLAVTICALSAAAAITACSAGERSDSEYKAGKYEESSTVTTTRPAVTSKSDTSSKTETSSLRDESSSKKEELSSLRDNDISRDDSGDVMSRIGEGIDDILEGGNDVIDDTIDTGRDVADDIFR